MSRIYIGSLGEEREYVSGNKNRRIDYVKKGDDIFKEGTQVIFNDPDDGEEFIGTIEWIVLNDDLTIQASINDIAYGRVDLEILNLY